MGRCEKDALGQVGNGKFLGWADHSGSKWRRGSARITDHKFQARQGAAKRDGSWEMGGWYGPILPLL